VVGLNNSNALPLCSFALGDAKDFQLCVHRKWKAHPKAWTEQWREPQNYITCMLVLSIVDGVDQLSREKWQFIHLVLSIKLKYGWLARDITHDSPNNSKINLNPFLITTITPLQHRRAPPHICSASFPYRNFYFTNLSVCLLDIIMLLIQILTNISNFLHAYLLSLSCPREIWCV